MSEHKQIELRPHRPYVIGLAGYALLGGLLTLAGWSGHLPRLTDWAASGISMFPNTAMAAVCSAAALLLGLRRRGWTQLASLGFGLVAALVGGTTVYEHLSGRNLGIDTLFLDPQWGNRAAVAPGRM